MTCRALHGLTAFRNHHQMSAISKILVASAIYKILVDTRVQIWNPRGVRVMTRMILNVRAQFYMPRLLRCRMFSSGKQGKHRQRHCAAS
jgi:hypothetical protein